MFDALARPFLIAHVESANRSPSFARQAGVFHAAHGNGSRAACLALCLERQAAGSTPSWLKPVDADAAHLRKRAVDCYQSQFFTCFGTH